MAGENTIILKNDRPDLIGDFTMWLNTKKESNNDFYWGEWYDWGDEWYDYYGGGPMEDDDERYDDFWNEKPKKNNKGKSKKTDNKLSDEEVDEIIHKRKEIYFYENIEDISTVHKFKNIAKFFKYLDEHGIDISDAEGSKFIRAYERHCCVNPNTLTLTNKKEIISDNSYAALAYEVNESILFND